MPDWIKTFFTLSVFGPVQLWQVLLTTSVLLTLIAGGTIVGSMLLKANIKLWQWTILLATSLVMIASGTIVYINFPKQSVSLEDQNVIVFVGGFDTEITPDNCQLETFVPLLNLLSDSLHFINPYHPSAKSYAPSCQASQNMKDKSISIAYFSYLGGNMNLNTGVWEPKPYNACDPDSIRLEQDIQTVSAMLHAYQLAYPNAHFTLVGHSLGGLVALRGAAEFVTQYGHDTIDKVITGDSPLRGVPDVLFSAEAMDNPGTCFARTGPAQQDLGQLDAHSQDLSQQEVTYLQTKGTAVYTLGNDLDCLYESVLFCKVAGISAVDDNETQYVETAFVKKYHIAQGTLSAHFGFAAGHGAIFSEYNAYKDIARFIMAPQITITRPQSTTVDWYDGVAKETPIDFSATLRCFWGNANHTSAMIKAEDSSIPLNVGTFGGHPGSKTLNLNGTFKLPASITGPSATFYLQASGNACQYPDKMDSVLYPQDTDYLNGVQFQVDGGRLALGINGVLYANRPLNGTLGAQSADYSTTGTIQSVAWSHDGTKLAYLVSTQLVSNVVDSSLSDLYIAVPGVHLVMKRLSVPNAVAVTWNSADTKVAILEETENNVGPGPGDFNYSATIVMADAINLINDPRGNPHIDLPASANSYFAECGIADDCYPPRASIMWSTDGNFLISYANVGSTFVTPIGKFTELGPGGQSFGRNGATLGTMNTQGTLIVYPTSDSNGNVSITSYKVSTASAQLGSPTTLATFPNSTQAKPVVVYSPDGTKLGVCIGSSIYMLDAQNPGDPQKIMDIPTAQSSGGLFCQDLRWSPDGSNIVVQALQFGGMAGLVIIPIDKSSPQVLLSCGLSYTTAFQYTERYDCPQGVVFDWQPQANKQ